MRARILVHLATAALLLGAAPALAHVSHGYSNIFSLDTVTAVADGPGGRPTATAITAIHPNPFHGLTTIVLALAEAGPVDLAIYDLRGRRVRGLETRSWPAGRCEAAWDGLDDAGRVSPAGTYFCRLSTRRASRTVKVTFAR